MIDKKLLISVITKLTDHVADGYNKKTTSPVDLSDDVLDNYIIKYYQYKNFLSVVSFKEVNSYFCSIEIGYYNEYYKILVRLPSSCVIYHSENNTYWYKNNMSDINFTPLNELERTTEIIPMDDWDEYSLFQYRMIEDNCDELFEIKKLIQKITSDVFYEELIKSPLRKY